MRTKLIGILFGIALVVQILSLTNIIGYTDHPNYSNNIGKPKEQSYTLFPSFEIEDNAHLDTFISDNGFSGLGTHGDPYIITGIEITDPINCVNMSGTSEDVIFENCYFHDCQIGINLSTIQYITIRNCVFESCSAYCILFSGNNQYININDNNIDQHYGTGYSLRVFTGSSHVNIFNNVIYNTQFGIQVEISNPYTIINNNTITNSVIAINNYSTLSETRYVTNNTIINATAYGIYNIDGGVNRVINNIIIGCDKTGIGIYGTVNDVDQYVEYNRISNVSTAIQYLGGMQYTYIQYNNISNVVDGIRITTYTGAIIHDNNINNATSMGIIFDSVTTTMGNLENRVDTNVIIGLNNYGSRGIKQINMASQLYITKNIIQSVQVGYESNCLTDTWVTEFTSNLVYNTSSYVVYTFGTSPSLIARNTFIIKNPNERPYSMVVNDFWVYHSAGITYGNYWSDYLFINPNANIIANYYDIPYQIFNGIPIKYDNYPLVESDFPFTDLPMYTTASSNIVITTHLQSWAINFNVNGNQYYPIPEIMSWRLFVNGTLQSNGNWVSPSTYTVSSLDYSENNYVFNMVFMNGYGQISNLTRTVTINLPPVITTTSTSTSSSTSSSSSTNSSHSSSSSSTSSSSTTTPTQSSNIDTYIIIIIIVVGFVGLAISYYFLGSRNCPPEKNNLPCKVKRKISGNKK